MTLKEEARILSFERSLRFRSELREVEPDHSLTQSLLTNDSEGG